MGSFRLLEFLRPLGYRFIYSGSHWEYTASHADADVNYIYDEGSDEFLDTLQDVSLLQAADMLGGDAALDWRERYWMRTHFQWDSLHDSIRLGTPKFVHAHIALPHSPYIFEPDGAFVPEDLEDARTREENYSNNVDYANKAVLELIDALLAKIPSTSRSSSSRPMKGPSRSASRRRARGSAGPMRQPMRSCTRSSGS
jgi:hypothetical protein